MARKPRRRKAEPAARVLSDPCLPFPPCNCPPWPPSPKNHSGPDEPGIACWVPTDCCGPSLCAVSKDDLICQIRQLLPEGEIWAPIMPTAPPELETGGAGATTVGCAKVGCEQLIFGSCCDDAIFCTDEPTPPNLALYDSFAAVTYDVTRLLCDMLKELDPCTAEKTRDRWGRRYGLITDDLCAPKWSDAVLATLLCTLLRIRQQIVNWEFLEGLAAQFGAALTLRVAGGFGECHPTGWWTMARDMPDCPPAGYCPPASPLLEPWIRMSPTCEDVPDSLNLIICPADVHVPANCNLRAEAETRPHDPELYIAFKWLLPKILPQPFYWCVYECDPANCIE